MLEIVELVSNQVVATATTWDEAYAKRDELQAAGLAAGYDLKRRRYGIRHVAEVAA